MHISFIGVINIFLFFHSPSFDPFPHQEEAHPPDDSLDRLRAGSCSVHQNRFISYRMAPFLGNLLF